MPSRLPNPVESFETGRMLTAAAVETPDGAHVITIECVLTGVIPFKIIDELLTVA